MFTCSGRNSAQKQNKDAQRKMPNFQGSDLSHEASRVPQNRDTHLVQRFRGPEEAGQQTKKEDLEATLKTSILVQFATA